MDAVDAGRITDALTGFLRTARLVLQHEGVRGLAGTQTGILRRVADRDRRLSELVPELLVDTSVVSRAVAELTKAGYLTRAVDPVDARACRLQLTPAGRAELDRRTTMTTRLVEQTFAELSPAELDQAVAVLHRLEVLLHGMPWVREAAGTDRSFLAQNIKTPETSRNSTGSVSAPSSTVSTLEPSA